MNAEEYLKKKTYTCSEMPTKNTNDDVVLITDAFEAVRLARSEEERRWADLFRREQEVNREVRIAQIEAFESNYLSEKEKGTLGDMVLLQYALGLESCKTKGEVVRILEEIQQDEHSRVLKEVKEWLEKYPHWGQFLVDFYERFLKGKKK